MNSNTKKGDIAVKTDAVTPPTFHLASSQTHATKPPEIDFHGASVINEQGEEIAITESMVQQACKIYIKQWEMAQKSSAND